MVAALREHHARGPIAELAEGLDSPALRELERSRCVARIAAVLDDVLAGAGAPRLAA
jgi:hypothetical protein